MNVDTAASTTPEPVQQAHGGEVYPRRHSLLRSSRVSRLSFTASGINYNKSYSRCEAISCGCRHDRTPSFPEASFASFVTHGRGACTPCRSTIHDSESNWNPCSAISTRTPRVTNTTTTPLKRMKVHTEFQRGQSRRMLTPPSPPRGDDAATTGRRKAAVLSLCVLDRKRNINGALLAVNHAQVHNKL